MVSSRLFSGGYAGVEASGQLLVPGASFDCCKQNSLNRGLAVQRYPIAKQLSKGYFCKFIQIISEIRAMKEEVTSGL